MLVIVGSRVLKLFGDLLIDLFYFLSLMITKMPLSLSNICFGMCSNYIFNVNISINAFSYSSESVLVYCSGIVLFHCVKISCKRLFSLLQ